MEKVSQALRKIPIGLIRLYQLWLSPMLGQNCRFHPTCSYYAIEAIKQHGIIIGGWLSIKRILMPPAAFRWDRSGARKEEAKQALKYLNLPI